jgi:tRNA(fMet)-specific endonuclease VapC
MVIELLRKKEKASHAITTVITIFEISMGAHRSYAKIKKLQEVQEILPHLLVLPLTIEAAMLAGEIAANLRMQGNALDFRDVMIAAIAITNNLPLRTNNKKHFSRIKELKVI